MWSILHYNHQNICPHTLYTLEKSCRCPNCPVADVSSIRKMLDCYLPAEIKVSATGERNRRRFGSSNSPFQIMLQNTTLFPKPGAVPNINVICPCSGVTHQYLRTELKGWDKFHIKDFKKTQKTPNKQHHPNSQNQLSHQICYSWPLPGPNLEMSLQWLK